MLQNKNMVREYVIIRIMKTFKDILISQDKKPSNDCIPAKTLQFLQKSYNLHLIKHFIIPQMRPFIIAITPSRRNKEELLFTFSNYPACVEFNKFHAKELLNIIKNNKTLQQKINLESYVKIIGYVPKNQLELYKVEYIKEEHLYEVAQGDFINHAKDPHLHDIFENIREIIQLRHKHMQNLKIQIEAISPTPYNIAQKPYKSKD